MNFSFNDLAGNKEDPNKPIYERVISINREYDAIEQKISELMTEMRKKATLREVREIEAKIAILNKQIAENQKKLVSTIDEIV